jgi:DNA-binding response OmpR family regulator
MKMKILAVDDDQYTLDLLQALMTSNDCEFATSVNAMHGLTLCTSFSPDVLLLDWTLPDVSGLDMLKVIRTTQGNADLFVIMLSGKIMTDNIVAAITAGADDYMIKPFASDELMARVNNGFRINRRRREETERIQKQMESVRKIDALCSQLHSAASGNEQLLPMVSALKAAADEMKVTLTVR